MVLGGGCLSSAEGAAGRGAVALLPGPELGLSFDIIARQYRRGGLLRRWRRALFSSPDRFLNELAVHARAWRLGLPVAEPLGVIALPPAPGEAGWQGFYLTRRFDTAVGLPEYLAAAGPLLRLRLASALGAGLRSLHQAGIFHADLQVHNIMVERGVRPLFIDFDKSRIVAGPLSAWRRRANLYRLARSLTKLYSGSGCVGRSAMTAFLQAYEPDPEAYRRLFNSLVRGLAWRRLFYRLGWRLNRS